MEKRPRVVVACKLCMNRQHHCQKSWGTPKSHFSQKYIGCLYLFIQKWSYSLYSFCIVAAINSHKFSSLKGDTELFSFSSGGHQMEVQVLAACIVFWGFMGESIFCFFQVVGRILLLGFEGERSVFFMAVSWGPSTAVRVYYVLWLMAPVLYLQIQQQQVESFSQHVSVTLLPSLFLSL